MVGEVPEGLHPPLPPEVYHHTQCDPEEHRQVDPGSHWVWWYTFGGGGGCRSTGI